MNKVMLKERINSLLEKQIIYFLYVYLLVDSINGILMRSSFDLPVSLSQIFKGILLIFMITFILLKMELKLSHLLITLFTVVFLTIIFLKDVQLGINFLKFLILPVSYVFALLYKLDGNEIKKIIVLNFTYIVVNIILGIMGFGYPQYEASQIGTRGFFFAGNDLSVVYIILSFFVLYILWTKYSKIFYMIFSVFLLFIASNLATKVAIFGIIVLIITFPLENIRFTKKHLIKSAGIFIGVLLLATLILKITSLEGLVNRTIAALERHNNLLSTFLSGRDIKLKRVFEYYANNFTVTSLLVGGSPKAVIEMDFFDAFFNYGILGLMALLFICIYGVYKQKETVTHMNTYYGKKLLFMNILIVIIAFLSGHVFFSATVNIFISLINVYQGEITNRSPGNRIFLISNMYPCDKYPFYGIFVKNTEEILEKKGYKTTLRAVITIPNQTKLNKLKSYFIFYMQTLKGIFRIDEYDLIYVHFISHSAIAVLILKLLVDKPLILNTHGSDVLLRGRFTKILALFSFLLAKLAEKIIVPSEFFKEVVMQKLKVSYDKIMVYPSGGVNTEIFKYEKKDSNNDSSLILGYVSRMEYGKGCDIFVEIIKRLNQKIPHVDVRGIMIGEGKDKNKCLQLIEDYNLTEKIEYLGGLSQEEISHYYNKFDLLIFPTRLNESLGLVGLEAMACGTPVVASSIGGIKTYIRHGENGYLVKVDDVDGFVKAVCDYKKLSKEDKERIINNAYQTALQYERTKVTDAFIAELQNIQSKS